MRRKGQKINMPTWQKPARPRCLAKLGAGNIYHGESENWTDKALFAMNNAFAKAMILAGHRRV